MTTILNTQDVANIRNNLSALALVAREWGKRSAYRAENEAWIAEKVESILAILDTNTI